MSYPQATLVQRIRWNLGDLPWEGTGTAANTTSTVVVNDGGDWAEGDIGEILDAVTGDTEIFRDSGQHSGNNVTAVRGYYGSTAAAHITTSRILKNPKFRYHEITNAISSVINDLPWPCIYKIVAQNVTASVTGGWGGAWGSSPWGGGSGGSSGPWYNLNAAALAIQSAYQETLVTPAELHTFGGYHSWSRIVLKRGLPASLAASGVGVAFPDGVNNTVNPVTVNYAAKITDTVATGDYSDLTAGDPIVEAIIYGATALMTGALEIRKPRHAADEVDNLRAGAMFNSFFERALRSAEKDLRQKSPLMDGWDK